MSDTPLPFSDPAPAPSAPPTGLPAGAVPHLLVAFAATGGGDGDAQEWLTPLVLPNLNRLLALRPVLQREATTPAQADLSLTPPHERAHAALLGLSAPDGQVPWAAWQTQSTQAAAWFTPCHQEVGNGHVTLQDPQDLALSEAHSRALLAALQPWAQEDGITLTWHSPLHWLAQGQVFEGLATASLDRAVGRSIAPWLPMGAAAAPLRRLQNEAQMLFYTHPAHDERLAKGMAPVNAFWISGSGTCPGHAQPSSGAETVPNTHLRAAALRGDRAGWHQAWRTLDAEVLPAWLARAQAGQPLRITLCGERSFVTLVWPERSTWQRWGTHVSSLVGTQRSTPLLASI